ncbi:MAG: arylsulfotransferase family protein [Solirubrobacterales bacterium]|nr:arylsulfotransferase family protein [Solirubrobacterales bacterium]
MLNETKLPRLAATLAATTAAALGPAAVATAATAPPPLKITAGAHTVGNGDIFVSPFGDAKKYANGAEILSPSGKLLWFHRAPAGQEDSDFRPQTLHGQPVLTFWQGTNLGGVSKGTDYIYNAHYKQIAAVHAGPGQSADGHEFRLTDGGNAWIIAYETATANLTKIGGRANQKVIDGVVQEINVKTGKVLFSWNSADHVPYSQSEQPLPSSANTPWDWFHLNAVKPTSDGNLLLSARDTWTTYKVSPRTGKIAWQLGGKASSFKETAARGQSLNHAGKIFAWQHDPEQTGPDSYTVFDNESAGTANTGAGASSELSHARVVTIKLDQHTRTAKLVSADNQPEGKVASSQGNGQRLSDGGEFVGWGILPAISEFSATGKLVFNAQFPTGVNTYRAYLLPWKGAPAR